MESFGHLENLEGKCLFFEKNCFLTLILDPEKICFGHLARFLYRFVTLALCLRSKTSSVKKISFWSCFKNCVEWSVLGKKTFSKGTHNFTFFFQIMSRTILGVWQKNLEQGCYVCILLVQWIFTRGKFFWRTFNFATFSDFEWSTCGQSAKTF